MAEQERSGPTPAQALEQVMFDAWNDQSRPIGEAVLAAIEAGEVPGVFAADGERPRRALWAVIAEAAGGRLSDDDARRIARAVEEEQDHG